MPDITATPSDQDHNRQEAHTVSAGQDTKWTARVTYIGLALVLGTLTVYLLLYLQTQQSGILLDTAGILGALLCLTAAHVLARAGRGEAAGYWLLTALVVSFAASELAWAGETWFNLIGGGAAILLVGRLVLPQKRMAWLSATMLYMGTILLISLFEPVARPVAATELPVLFLFDLGLTALLVLLGLWMIYRAFLSGSIRTRLLLAFVSLALLIAAAVGTTALHSVSRNTKIQAVGQLGVAANLMQTEIETWMATQQNDLQLALIDQTANEDAHRLLQQTATGPQMLRTAYQRLGQRLSDVVQIAQHLDELFLIDAQGQIVRSSNPQQEGESMATAAVFQEGLKGPYQSAPALLDSDGQGSLFVSRPIQDARGRVAGVLAGRVGLEGLLSTLAEGPGLGQSGETYLVDSDYHLLTPSRFDGYTPGRSVIHSTAIDKAVLGETDGAGLYDNYSGVPVVGAYRWMPQLDVALVTEQDQAVALSAITTLQHTILGIAGVAIALAVVASLWVTRGIANPLSQLTVTAARISEGDLTLTAPVERSDEVGALAQSFNRMTARLNGLIADLESQVTERTKAAEMRSAYLEAAAEVGRAAASILDVDQLRNQAVELIREGFGLYFVGLFEMDDEGQYAVLRAGTGQAGRQLLSRGHRIRIGKGMVGWCIENAEPRITLEVEEDALRLATHELPYTRSEAALPLRSRNRVLGALTVQSDQPAFFGQDAVIGLQAVADQVAVALDNAQLFAESQSAIEAQRRAFGDISREAWLTLLRSRRSLGYRRTKRGMKPITQIEAQGLLDTSDGDQLGVPVKIRGNILGVLRARRPQDGGEWQEDEIALLETLVDQLGQALENARLHQETQRRAVREQLAREITEKVRAAPDVESIAATAAEELVKALGGSRGFVRLQANDGNAEQSDGQNGGNDSLRT